MNKDNLLLVNMALSDLGREARGTSISLCSTYLDNMNKNLTSPEHM